jgi:sulfonate transport system ATP-binding protein
VDEALALADRVLVLTDGRIGYSCPVDAPRPRDRDLPDLITARADLLAELGVPTEGIGGTR